MGFIQSFDPPFFEGVYTLSILSKVTFWVTSFLALLRMRMDVKLMFREKIVSYNEEEEKETTGAKRRGYEVA